MSNQKCINCGRYTAKKKAWLSSKLKCDYCGAVTSQTRKAIRKGIIWRKTIGHEEYKFVKGGQQWRQNWNHVRDKALKKAGYKCQHCGSPSNLHVHHKKQVANGGKDKLSNLIVLCQSCHHKVHAKTRQGKGCFIISFGIQVTLFMLVILLFALVSW